MDYSKYKFNYFDVVKRHERIINRPKDWEIKVLACIMLFVTFCYVFTSGVFAIDDETSSLVSTVINGYAISQNTIVEDSSRSIAYISIIKGHTYRFVNDNYTNNFVIYKSDSIDVGSSVSSFLNYSSLPNGSSYEIVAENDYFLTYFVSTNIFESGISVYDITNGQTTAVSKLVNNVGVNQIWGVFENGVSFVGVVILVAFGLFLVVLAIKKLSKGKSEF